MEVPVYTKRKGRSLKRIPTVPPHESVQCQVEENSKLSTERLSHNADFQAWHRYGRARKHVRNVGPTLPIGMDVCSAAYCGRGHITKIHNVGPTMRACFLTVCRVYQWHPGVQSCCPEQPLLISLYADGIRFTRSERVGKTDTLLAFFVHSLVEAERHTVALLRKSESCRCGCRGWCTIYPIMLMMSWSFKALLRGKRPDRDHEGHSFPQNDWRASHAGTDLRRGVLVWIKGDLAEQSITYGLRGLGSGFHPCFLCRTLLDNMHQYNNVSLVHDEWGDVDPMWEYEQQCQQHEVKIMVRTEDDRHKVIGHWQNPINT